MTLPPAVIRMMLRADDDRPRVPQSPDESAKWGLLAVRPKAEGKKSDVSAAADTDPVHPPDPTSAEGLSCSKATADVYCQRFRPPGKRERVWEIETAALPAGLMVVPNELKDDPDHMLIVPARVMTLGEFQRLLASTRPSWRVVEYLVTVAASPKPGG